MGGTPDCAVSIHDISVDFADFERLNCLCCRYRRNEKFTWHLDALAPSDELEEKGGQRIATVLVYLTDLKETEGGATMFRDLGGKEGPLRV